ncbi:MAG: VWA domain-containing protein [Opitutaceae bacterium]|jgi:Ca-activated chloride channel family protein
MSFQWPHAFWLLIVPLALLIRDLRRRATGGAAHPKIIQAEATHSSLVIRHSSFRRGNASRTRILLYLGLAAATAALARPQWGRIEEPVFDQAREILIALDLSRSMLSTDVKPTRLDRSRLLITSLLEQLKGERVGLVVFSGTAFLQSPLSSDYEILGEFLPELGPDFLPEGGTNYNALLETCLAAFGTSGAADRFLIILSDGEAQSDDWHNHVDELKTKGIRVISLGVGTPEGSMIPDGSGAFMKDERGAVVLSKLNNSTLRELADKTNGVYADASTWVDLAQLVQTTVNQGKRGEFKDVSHVRLAERYQWALAPALLFLIWSFWREFPVRPKPRTLRMAINQTLTPTAPVTTLALLFIASLVIGHWSFAAAVPAAASDPLAAPVTKLVGQLSAREIIAARDYATFAKTTIDYGERLTATQQPVPPGPVNDALAGVKAGRSLDPKAADWPTLRKKLEALLQKKDQPDQDQKKPDQKQPDKNKSDDSQKDKSDQKQDQKNQDKKDDPSKSPDQDQNRDGSSPKDSKTPSSNAGAAPDQKNSPEPKPPQAGQSAFGDMKDDKKGDAPKSSDTPPSTQPPGDMQQVGGKSEKQKDEAAQLDPSLEVPLQKLDQVRQQDSPARLFQLLQDPNSQVPARKGPNW